RNCSGCQPSPPCSFGHFPVSQPREPRRFSQASYSWRSRCWPRACLLRTSAGISLAQNSRTSLRKASSSALCWTARMNMGRVSVVVVIAALRPPVRNWAKILSRAFENGQTGPRTGSPSRAVRPETGNSYQTTFPPSCSARTRASPARRRLRQQKREQTQGRQPRAKLEDGDDADLVGEQAKSRGRQPAEPERQAVEQSAHETDAMRDQVDRID